MEQSLLSSQITSKNSEIISMNQSLELSSCHLKRKTQTHKNHCQRDITFHTNYNVSWLNQSVLGVDTLSIYFNLIKM